MKPWRNVAADALPEGFDLMDWKLPEYSEESLLKCRSLCAENKCGSYGRTWGCPPGYSGNIRDLRGKYDMAGVFKKRFEVDLRDVMALEKLGEDLQTHVRNVVLALRREGYVSEGFSDGGCRYCGVCSYPEPCRFPEMLIPSVSALGIDMAEFAKANGEGFAFEKDAVTLYGVVFIGSPRYNLLLNAR